jgi:uncharacterized surface protein with fasciclin (FAS1) repeats
MRFLSYLVLLALFTVGCKDTWEDHIRLNGDVSDKTIVAILEQNPDYSEFLVYLKKSGLDKELASSKIFTLWVPDNNAMASVDPTILNDSAKLKLFVGNHFSREQMTIQGIKMDTLVKVFNGKSLEFDNADSLMDGVKITAGDIFAKNGVIHHISQVLNPRLNIWQYISNEATPNEHVNYLKSLSNYRLVVNYNKILGTDPVSGRPVYGIDTVRYNSFLEDIADLNSEDSVYTFFIVDDAVYTSEFQRFFKYFWVENGTTSSDTAMIKKKITKDFVFKGAYKQIGFPDSLISLSGVKVPFKGSAQLLYRASNGYIYKVSDCAIRLQDKIPVIKIEAETADKYLLPTISINGANKRFRPGASGGYDFILDNHGQAAAEYADGTSNPNAGGFALHVKEIASVKYKISWKAVNDFRAGLRNPNDTAHLRQKLAFTQIARMSGNQPVWQQVSLITPAYVQVIDNSYATAQERELAQWTFSRMREDIYFQILCGGQNMSVALDYLKLEPIFQ